MHIGSLRVRLFVRQSRSLKDKRQVLRAIMDRLRDGFNVAVAEVDSREDHQVVQLGIVTVAEDAESAKTTIDRIAEALRGHPIAEFCEAETQVEGVFV